ncbi:T9SS type A sorting domain-containing protein [Flavobacterium sp.]|uniref:T9SS type A sorting domain-containing protein n=1 Tax=Flavobacterium sp. TaxID=239 RepID=UPI001210C862|nr:T9SS type A sorting domain-containing protein [Flavobacterium sp.]RZJ73673.1 MAG: T9SS type A sorting domain-containing protein [Flavobacterium sp.]
MRKLLLLSLLSVSFLGYCQLDPPGCYSYGVLDGDNDGFVTIDADYLVHSYAIPMISEHIQYDLEANYQMDLTAWDYDGYVTGMWTTVIAGEQTTEIQYTYLGPAPQYVPSVYYESLGYHSCFLVRAIDPGADMDADGILNADEDLNGDGILENDDSDADSIPDYTDPFELKADDFSKNEIRLFPNPASSLVSIVGADEKAAVAIFDLHGRKLKQQSVSSEVNVSGFSSGIYLMQITSSAKTQTIRFVKQ